MDLALTIQLLAMGAVRDSTPDYRRRKVLRWYSKTFHTPLHVVYTLPFDEILQHYFEEVYGDMEEYEREEEISLLIETEQERKEREQKEVEQEYNEEVMDRRFLEMSKQQAQAKKAKDEMEGTLVPTPSKPKEPTPLPPPSLDDLKNLPEIDYKFSEELEKELEEINSRGTKRKDNKW